MYIEHETPEDRTARMLRRISIEQVEQLAKELNIFSIDNTDARIDKEFLYDHGYTLDEYFTEAMAYKSAKSIPQSTETC
jgi:patatin-like phospholipase/acyl hydrolase